MSCTGTPPQDHPAQSTRKSTTAHEPLRRIRPPLPCFALDLGYGCRYMCVCVHLCVYIYIYDVYIQQTPPPHHTQTHTHTQIGRIQLDPRITETRKLALPTPTPGHPRRKNRKISSVNFVVTCLSFQMIRRRKKKGLKIFSFSHFSTTYLSR